MLLETDCYAGLSRAPNVLGHQQADFGSLGRHLTYHLPLGQRRKRTPLFRRVHADVLAHCRLLLQRHKFE